VTLLVVAVLAIALLAVVMVLAGLLRSQQRAHARREDLLVNQILHLSGRTWQSPPAGDDVLAKLREKIGESRGDREAASWIVSPEQMPVE
jgi:hypothetical protein